MTITKDNGKDFDWVIEELSAGRQIRRNTWNFHEYIKLEFTTTTRRGWMFLKTRIDNSGHATVSPWLASYEDIVASDWWYV